jgi:hypothetical protein
LYRELGQKDPMMATLLELYLDAGHGDDCAGALKLRSAVNVEL